MRTDTAAIAQRSGVGGPSTGGSSASLGIGGGIGTSRMRLAVLGATGAALIFGASCVAAKCQQISTQFDGTYTGIPKADKGNRSPPCTAPQIAVLDVVQGNARMRSSIDRRKGQVQPDGTLTLRGELVVGSQHIPGFVDGKFDAGKFEGVSRFPQVHCVYVWSLMKSD